VHLLALLLGGTPPQGFQLGAVVPVGTSRAALAARRTWTEPRPTWCRWSRRPCHRRCGCPGTFARLGRGIGPAWGRSRGASHRLLQLHQLARCHRFAHAAGHAGALRAACTGSCRWSGTTAASRGTAVPADGLAHQFQRVSAAAGGGPGTCRPAGTAGTLRDAGPGALR
jgi:hypothetical protein